ncbi:hypothetical protein [Arthrobacter sp. STN4]|uniref:hypothetical protein n=1 Tax=Arthrobacter sp. STN4 TaxID=2923276 RepID=UPI00211A80F4|nr:hypothetical protein [Arthrobacter sp. STN4]MCQ9165941.1 hypothetical protein [Arthrobacter sp. STN4]
MKKMLLQSFALAFGIVVVVLGIMILIGKGAFLPYFIIAAVLLVAALAFLYRGKAGTAGRK